MPLFGAYLILFLLSIFWWKNFPVAYVDGSGLTKFKDYSEYIVAIAFLFSAYLFLQKRKSLDSKVIGLLALVAFLFSTSTVLFTFYVGVYGFFNLAGHLIRVATFYPIYLGVVEFGLMQPYEYLFRHLKPGEDNLRKNEKRLRDVLKRQTDVVCRLLPAGTLPLVNEAYCRYYGKSEEDLLGNPYLGTIPKAILREDKELM